MELKMREGMAIFPRINPLLEGITGLTKGYAVVTGLRADKEVERLH